MATAAATATVAAAPAVVGDTAAAAGNGEPLASTSKIITAAGAAAGLNVAQALEPNRVWLQVTSGFSANTHQTTTKAQLARHTHHIPAPHWVPVVHPILLCSARSPLPLA